MPGYTRWKTSRYQNEPGAFLLAPQLSSRCILTITHLQKSGQGSVHWFRSLHPEPHAHLTPVPSSLILNPYEPLHCYPCL